MMKGWHIAGKRSLRRFPTPPPRSVLEQAPQKKGWAKTLKQKGGRRAGMRALAAALILLNWVILQKTLLKNKGFYYLQARRMVLE